MKYGVNGVVTGFKCTNVQLFCSAITRNIITPFTKILMSGLTVSSSISGMVVTSGVHR